MNREIEDIYPLAPLQEGMLFHGLLSPGTGVYLEQWGCELAGALDRPAFEQAWSRVLSRHAALRTAFNWELRKQPFQVVYKSIPLPLEHHDWSGLAAVEQQRRLEELLAADRERDFDLTDPPLLRFTLVRLGEESHWFIWTHHHLLLDGWSVPLLLDEAVALYGAFRRGEELYLPPPLPYRDYLVWLKQRDLAAAERFWRQALAGFSEPTIVAVNRKLPGREGTHLELAWLEPELTASVEAFARSRQVTLNTLVAGAWALVLHRFSGREDVLFGVTVSGRPPDLPGVERRIGLFINTLPMRARIAGETPLVDWLRDLQALQAEMRQYEYTPLIEIQGWSEIPRGRAMFESLLVFENYPLAAASGSAETGLRVLQLRSQARSSFPLNLVVIPGDRLELRLTYDLQSFDRATVRRLLTHFRLLLERMASGAERLWDLASLDEAERHQLLREWNDTAVAFPGDLCLHDLVARQAARTPGAVAVAAGDRQVTYRDLDLRAGQLACHLAGLGVGPEVPVALCVERSVEMVVGLLGILKAGAAYVPLDPGHPRERLAETLADIRQGGREPVLLTEERLTGRFPAHRGPLVRLDADWQRIAAATRDAPAGTAAPGNAAYVIYTSGSTGRPKGVVVEHRQIVNYLQALANRLGLTAGASFALVQPLTFDSCNTALYPPLVSGGTLHIVSVEDSVDPRALADRFRRHPVDGMKITPSHLAALQSSPPPGAVLPRGWLVLGGEALRWDWARELLHLGGSSRVFNHYGPTEATVGSLTCRVEAALEPGPSLTTPLGRPLPNTCAYVLDHHLVPTPLGVMGELCLAGAGVARGYLGRSELTAERFVPDPFAGSPGARLYRTGDLARHLPDGKLEFLGRADHQVKIRGFRVELGEIEAVLCRHPAVRESVVAVRLEEAGPRLVGYVVAREDAPPAAEALQQFLQERLPEYMVPASFVTLEALPRTFHGKLDRKALPAPEEAAAEDARRPVPPRNEMEFELAKIWGDLLGGRAIGVRDNFFEIGGHSLLAVRMMARVKERFGRLLSLADLMRAGTVEQLAIILQQDAEARSQSPLVIFRSTGHRPPLFLVHPGGGGALCYRHLAEELGPDHPCYGLQARGYSTDQGPHARVEEMARYYLDTVRRVQPGGPYHVGGWSFGGLVAFEMARQLLEEGADEVVLVLLDTLAPENLPEQEADDSAILELYLRAAGLPVRKEELRLFEPEERLARVADLAAQADLLPRGAGLLYLRRLLSVQRVNIVAARQYVPRPYPGRIVLFKASEAMDEQVAELRAREPMYGWDRHASEPVEVYPVPGNHQTLIQPEHAQELSVLLREVLASPCEQRVNRAAVAAS